ncbi:MAG: penicillin-binding protein 1A [Bacteroidota bacterium]
MSDSDKQEHSYDERFFNDPEYRRKILEERRKNAQKQNNGNNGGSSSPFNLNKRSDSSSPSTKDDEETSASQKNNQSSGNGFSLNKSSSKSSFKSSLESKRPKRQSIESFAASGSSAEAESSNPNERVSSDDNDPPVSSAKPTSNSGSGNDTNEEFYSSTGSSGQLSWNNIGKILTGFIILSLVGGMSFGYYLYLGLPTIEQLENPDTAIASFVKSRDGVILDKYYTENRTYVPIEEISPNVVNALIATEDHRFYKHWGIDMIRTLAIPYHILRGNPQGGSTLTQQLARNLYKKIGREFSVTRKLREMITAVQIERNYTKREIIEMYLNTVEFSNSAYGIEAAAQTHYGKSAKDLNVLEAATMIGSLQAVYAYNPRLRPEASQSRRNTVLYQMNKRKFLTTNEYRNLREEPIRLDYHPPSKTNRESRYFGEYVRLKVQDWAKENNYDLHRDGLNIYTTIDSRMQKYAERSVNEKLDSLQTIFEKEWTSREEWNKENGEYMDELWAEFPKFLRSFLRETDRYKNGFANYNTKKEAVVFDSLLADSAFVDSVKRAKTKLQASFVAIDPGNGNVLAWVGGKDFGNKQFDHVYQSRRQAGSTFKPFVYAVAIDNGYKPYHKFSKYPSKYYDRSGNVWDPKDPTVPNGPEMITLRQALARSYNNITVRLLPEIAGAPNTNELEDLYPAAKKIVKMAKNMGIESNSLRPYPSIALGTAEVTLLEMVSAYTTFANEGVHIDPIAITRIEDREGNILAEYHPEFTREVISPETAYIMLDMLRGVVRGVKLSPEDKWPLGTGVRLRNMYGVRQDVAAKTGTTQNSADNWFIAMMPHIVMGAWVGGEDRRVRFPDDTYIGQGARSALPIVGTFINYATSDESVPWSYDGFSPPKGFVMPEDPNDTPEENPVKSDEKGRIGW